LVWFSGKGKIIKAVRLFWDLVRAGQDKRQKEKDKRKKKKKEGEGEIEK
jgi:hypothetical protein